jgi:hypothetical protein
MDEETLKINLLSFLERHGAYSSDGQACLPGGRWADLREFLSDSGADENQLEELLQKMRESWQLAAFWFNGQWLAFYTQKGHEELNRLRGAENPAPVSEVDVLGFWVALENCLRRQGCAAEAQTIGWVKGQSRIMEASRQVFAKLGLS